MGKTKETKDLERTIFNTVHKTGTFCCFEVTIGFGGRERVDMLSLDTKGIFRCFEIKVSESDFHSKASKSFVGHYNYYVMNRALYEKVKDEIPKEIGVYVGSTVVKKPKKQTVSSEMCDILKYSMIRSLHRYLEEHMKMNDDTEYHRMKKSLANAKYRASMYYKKWKDAERQK